MMRKIKLFCRFAKPYTFRFVGLFVVVLTTIFISSIYPSLFGKMVDEVFYQKDINALIQIVVLFLGMYLINQPKVVPSAALVLPVY